MKIVSWNVAGIRGSFKKGALDWLRNGEFDIICFQETKCTKDEALRTLPDWTRELYPYQYWQSCTGEFVDEGFQRKGLNGTAIWSKTPCINDFGRADFDKEGRITAVEFKKFTLVNVYTPNAQSLESNRYDYRVSSWDVAFREYVALCNIAKPVVICGDFNVAHLDIDVYKPYEFYDMVTGFTNKERENFTRLLSSGFIDCYRHFNPTQEKAYTFWDQKLPYLRRTNRGWRIDYFLLSAKSTKWLQECNILPDVLGSDHCPLTLTLEFVDKTKHRHKRKLVIVNKL